MIVAFAMATHVGSVRSDNQDAVVIDGWVGQAPWLHRWGRARLRDRETWTAAVVDGMGGYAGGATAALLVAAALSTSLRGFRPATEGAEEAAGAWRAAYQQASDVVTDVARRAPTLSQMGATAAAVVVHPRGLVITNVGDARVYRLWRGYFTQLSEDDRTPHATTVSQALGPHLRGTPDPHVLDVRVREKVRLLLCSDGLWDVASNDDIEGIVGEEADLEEAARLLIEAALMAGGRDNVSLILIDLFPDPEEVTSQGHLP
jgi:serine/threonine protein phosphatase PrpC